MSPFCGTTGTLCFGLWFTLPTDFKGRVDAPLPMLDVTCAKWILVVNSGQARPQTTNLWYDEWTCYQFGQLRISKFAFVPNNGNFLSCIL